LRGLSEAVRVSVEAVRGLEKAVRGLLEAESDYRGR